MRDKHSAQRPPLSTRQLPLRAQGLHVHDATPERTSRLEEIKNNVAAYPALNLYWSPTEIKAWANRHPAATCDTDRALLDRIGFLLTRNKEKPFCKVSHKKLANKLGVCRRTIKRRLDWLRNVDAIGWENRKNQYGADIENEYVIKLDHSRSESGQRVRPPVTPPCDTPVTPVTDYARTRYTTLYESKYTTRQVQKQNRERQICNAHHGIRKTAGDKRRNPLMDNKTIAVITCLDGSVYTFDDAFIADIGPYFTGIDLKSLIVDMAIWYEAHPDRRTNRSVLGKDLTERLNEWTATGRYHHAERTRPP